MTKLTNKRLCDLIWRYRAKYNDERDDNRRLCFLRQIDRLETELARRHDYTLAGGLKQCD